jgi:hypothetical protein
MLLHTSRHNTPRPKEKVIVFLICVYLRFRHLTLILRATEAADLLVVRRHPRAFVLTGSFGGVPPHLFAAAALGNFRNVA